MNKPTSTSSSSEYPPPLIIETLLPKFKDNIKSIVAELIKVYKINDADILTVRCTLANNGIIQCANKKTYDHLINKEAHSLSDNGSISPLRSKDSNNTILILGASAGELKTYIDGNMKDDLGIVDYRDFNSNSNKMVRAEVKSEYFMDKLVGSYLYIAHQRCLVKKYERRTGGAMICFNCAQFGHRSAGCRNPKKCYKCSSINHSGYECPSKTDNKVQLQCPSCGLNHPQTFAGCSAYREFVASKHPVTRSAQSSSYINQSSFAQAVNQNNNQDKILDAITKMNEKMTLILFFFLTLFDVPLK